MKTLRIPRMTRALRNVVEDYDAPPVHPLDNLAVHEVELDLADQAQWEDLDLLCSLAEAGLEEEPDAPTFGFNERVSAGINDYVSWWLDEDSAIQLY